MSLKKVGPSLKPQKINSMLWYYEYRGSIELIVDLPELCRRDLQTQPWQARIPKGKLLRSLARMQGKGKP